MKRQEIRVDPFLKWAGGKRWLVRQGFKPPAYTGTYIEPFLGSGSFFFHHLPNKSVLSDINASLVEVFNAVKISPDAVFNKLKDHARKHDESYYYKVRSQKPRTEVTRAARFIYLNRTCWNGLYRENLKGQFNVPIGTKQTVIFPGDDFEAIAKALSGAEIIACDFEVVLNRARKGDLIFADPPYTVKHNMNGFVKYNQKLFTWDDQVRLRDCLLSASERGAKIVLTNANHESVRGIYKNDFTISSMKRASVIAGASDARVGTTELIIKNF